MSHIPLIPSEVIINKVIQDFRPNNTGWIVDGLRWIEEGLREIGYNGGQEEVRKTVAVVDMRATLPCSIENLLGVYYEGCWLPMLNAPAPDNSVIARTSLHNTAYIDIAFPYIKTSFISGDIEVHYLDFARDEEGKVLVPDVEEAKTALAYKIIMQLILQGMSHHIFSFKDAKDLWEDYKWKAQGIIAFPSPPEYQRIMSYWNNITGHSRNSHWAN